MTKRLSIIATVMIAMGVTPTAAAFVPTLHGLLGGMNLTYGTPPANPTVMTPGSGYIDGVEVQLQPSPRNSLTMLLTTGLTIAASTAYYCYIVNGNVPVAGTPFLPNTVSFVCSTIGPTADGHPTTNISGANFTSTGHALFVGSVLTDPNKAVLPFYRNGQQVLLNQAQVVPYTFATPGGVTSPDPIDPGADLHPAVLSFLSTAIPPTVLSYKVSPLPLLSLSAVLYDFQIVNSDASAHNVSFLDPSSHAITCVGGTCTKACEGEAQVDATTSSTPPAASVATYRAALNVDSTGAIWVGMDVSPSVNSVQVFPVLRGYIEPIKHLFGR